MPAYRVTLVFNQSVMGVSETLYTPELSVIDAPGIIEQYLRLRCDMLWTRHQIVGVRVGVYGAKRRSIFFPPGDQPFPNSGKNMYIPATGFLNTYSSTNRPDQLRAVMHIRVTYDGNRNTIRYLSGVPDADTITEPDTLNLGGLAPWNTAYLAWGAFIKAQHFQIRARVGPPTNPIIQVVKLVSQSPAPGLLGLVVPSSPTPNFVRGDQVAVTNFRPKKTLVASINGSKWYVDSVNNTLIPDSVVIYLQMSEGVDPASQKHLGTIQKIGYALYPIEDIYAFRVGIHKRGRPSPAPVGRRKTRLSLDP